MLSNPESILLFWFVIDILAFFLVVAVFMLPLYAFVSAVIELLTGRRGRRPRRV